MLGAGGMKIGSIYLAPFGTVQLPLLTAVSPAILIPAFHREKILLSVSVESDFVPLWRLLFHEFPSSVEHEGITRKPGRLELILHFIAANEATG
jgi:hypothetical protein